MVAWFILLAISVALSIISYLITPKPKQPKPDAAKQQDNPTAEAGVERPVIFGTIIMQQPNCMWFGDKSMRTYNIKSSSGGASK